MIYVYIGGWGKHNVCICQFTFAIVFEGILGFLINNIELITYVATQLNVDKYINMLY